MKVGYAFVVADIFHVGILRILRTAKNMCDWLIVGVLTDEAVSSYKRTPIIPFDERVEIVRALKCVDMVVKQDAKDPTKTLSQLIADGWEVELVFHGDDWDKIIERGDYIRMVNMKIVRLPYYDKQSTTKIIRKIRSRKQ